MYNKFSVFMGHLTAVAAAIALSACGGGGGSSSTSSTGGTGTCSNGGTDYPTCTAPVTPANLQTSVPVPTYAANSVQLASFNEINNIRASLGLGLLAQNVYLDLAAQNHANYIGTNFDANPTSYSHYEVSTLPGFTGTDPSARAQSAGYGTGTAEVLTGTYNGVTTTDPVVGLLDTVYHRGILLNQCFRDIGIGYSSKSQIQPFVADISQKSTCQTNASDFVMNYPMNGQVGVQVSMSPEAPNPIANMPVDQYGNPDFAKNTSYPISISSADGSTLAVTTITVTAAGSSVPVTLRTITNGNDINGGIGANNVYFIGTAPFASATTYNVAFVGTVNGKAVTRNFSFTTK